MSTSAVRIERFGRIDMVGRRAVRGSAAAGSALVRLLPGRRHSAQDGRPGGESGDLCPAIQTRPAPERTATPRTAAGDRAVARRSRRDARLRPVAGSLYRASRPAGVRSAGSARPVAGMAAAPAWSAVATVAVFALVAVVLVRSVATIQPTDAGRNITVLPGETLWSIAQQSLPGVDPRDGILQIEKLNGLTSSQVPAGVVLRLPASIGP